MFTLMKLKANEAKSLPGEALAKSGSSRGFTLIELLVVIAIIGILSGIVLASLGTARDKANDAAIKSTLSGMRAQAELVADTNGGHYGVETNPAGTNCTGAGSGVLFSNATILQAMAQVENINSGTAVCVSSDGIAGTGGNATSWAISSALRSSATTFFCVDSTGKATTTTTATGNGGGATAAAAACP